MLWWAGSRLLVLGTVAVMQTAKGPRGTLSEEAFAEPFGLLGVWDGRWYRIVAERGYLLVPGHQSDPAFFPLYPILLDVAGALGLSPLAAGIVIANLALLGAILAVYELGRSWLPESDAFRAARYVALAPVGFVFSMAYPQSLALLLVALAACLALRGRWLSCGCCAALAVLARPEALFVVLPVAAVVVRLWPRIAPLARGPALAAVFAPAAALAAFPAYLGWTLDDWHAWSAAQEAWGRSFRADGIVRAVEGLGAPAAGWLARDAAFFAVYALALVVAARAGAPRGWVAAGAFAILLPLMSGSFQSTARFGLLAVAVYWGLAVAGRRRWVDGLLTAAAAGLLVAGTLTIPLAFP